MRPFHRVNFAVLLALVASATTASAAPTREDYRYFRALSIDLQGRIPTAEELTEFERPGFAIDTWIDQRLQGAAYAERLRRVYQDLLRLEIGNMFQYGPAGTILRRVQLQDPDGNPVWVYFRRGQRRDGIAIDGDVCFSPEESGITVSGNGTLTGTARPIDRTVFNARTVEVRPWWIYRDYRAANPSQRIAPPATWDGSLTPRPTLLMDADGRTPTTTIRVCREEAQATADGAIFLTGRTTRPTAPFAGGRLTTPPTDSTYARANPMGRVSCTTSIGFSMSRECGCGVGMERCLPAENAGVDPGAFVLPDNVPLGHDAPLDVRAQTQGDWVRYWWGQEAQQFLLDAFSNDRDVRELLTSRATMVNGPLAHFYRFNSNQNFPTSTAGNYVEPQSLFDPARVPDVSPHELTSWRRVADRGPQAAGLLTMPIFLTKYGTRRARAHIVYQAFLCRQFVAENVQLMPSTENNLMLRPGCASCHATLEPMSAYFTRVTESNWTFLPAAMFPAVNPSCRTANFTRDGSCTNYYDRIFSSEQSGMLRGAYGSPANADAGPIGFARSITEMPEYAQCVASNVAESFLGRTLGPDDQQLRTQLTEALRTAGYHPRAMVRALVRADAYRAANNLDSSTWRQGGMP